MFDTEYNREILRTIIVVLSFVLINFSVKKLTRKYAKGVHLSEHRTNLVSKYIDFFMFALICIIIFAVWGIKSDDVFGFIGTTLTIIGVAFFAQWSILSNITSGIIMFFTFPFRIGDVIRIHDKDFPIEAQIEDIKTFHTILRNREGELITYPNSLLLQKGVSIVPIKQDDKEFFD